MSFLSGRQPRSKTSWTVSQLTSYIGELFDIDFRLRDVEVTGEISNFTRARSGHLYFTLKDSRSQLKCVMWRSAAERLTFQPDSGDAVVANGRISIYEAGGVYQLYADKLSPAGRGDLAVAFERLKQQLADEGLFDPELKKPLPPFPRKIGIVTSADAAALRDILHVLQRRYPLVSILIAPALVQGADAPPQLVRSLRWLDGRHDIDTIIVARGGGSIEDLWAFNDEHVTRAIFAAQHPIISGVGHETDFTMADFVADVRAPTPSAAAELAVPDREELQALVQGEKARLLTAVSDQIAQRQWQVDSLARALGHLTPRTSLDSSRQAVDGLRLRLERAMSMQLRQQRAQLSLLQASLSAVSPLATLARGYAIVRDAEGKIVRSITETAVADRLNVQLQDGHIDVTVTAHDTATDTA